MPAPANDNFADAQVITGQSGAVTVNNTGATEEVDEPNLDAAGKTVWCKWVAPANMGVQFDTLASAAPIDDTTLGAYTGVAVNALTQVGFSDDFGAGALSALTFLATSGTTYFIQAGTFGGAEEGDIVLTWTGTDAERVIGSCTTVPFDSLDLHPAALDGSSDTKPWPDHDWFAEWFLSKFSDGDEFDASFGFQYDATKPFNGHDSLKIIGDGIYGEKFLAEPLSMIWTRAIVEVPTDLSDPANFGFQLPGVSFGPGNRYHANWGRDNGGLPIEAFGSRDFGTIELDAPYPLASLQGRSVVVIDCFDVVVVGGINRIRSRLYVGAVGDPVATLLKTETELNQVHPNIPRLWAFATAFGDSAPTDYYWLKLFEWVACRCAVPYSGLDVAPYDCCATTSSVQLQL